MSHSKHRDKYEQTGVAMTSRSFQEYRDMFVLQEEDFRKGPVLDVSAGASSFTSELKNQGYQAFAVDPLYTNSSEDLKVRGLKEIEESTEKLAGVSYLYDWSYYDSLENHQMNRKHSLTQFISDYERYKNNGRYVAGKLPNLPFANDTFSLIICNHFLFLYEEQFDFDFHYAALKELLRICKRDGEVRVYPTVGFDHKTYRKMDSLQRALERDGACVDYINTDFRFLKNATHVLRLRKAK